jgi:hypothetical protein
MTKSGEYTWNNIKLTTDSDADYNIVLNSTNEKIDFKKSILCKTDININHYSKDIENSFYKVLNYYNLEWGLSKNYEELKNITFDKNSNISTILTDCYKTSGQMKIIDFVKFLESKSDLTIDIFGINKYNYKNYKEVVDYSKKDKALFPYKYCLIVEDNDIKNYFTNKLTDAILSECLVFYCGCYNIKHYINENAFISINLDNFENDYNIIQKAIKEDWYIKRLKYIKEAKNKILEELYFFPIIEKILI